MANTFVKLSSASVGAGGASSIAFTNIPQTYSDLKIVLSTRRSPANVWGTYILNINSDSPTDNNITVYGSSYTRSDGSNASQITSYATNSAFASEGVGSGATANIFDNTEITISDYCNNQNVKAISSESVGENQATTAYMVLVGATVQTTDPVTAVTITPGSGTFLQYSTATLYGVFNADVSAAPSEPTIGTVTAGSAQASIAFTGVSNAASYTATSTPGSLTATGAISPIIVSGLTANTSYTFKVKANNPFGSSSESSASSSVTPVGAGVFESIATAPVSAVGGASSVTFSSIPNTYSSLQIRAYSRCSTAGVAMDEIQLTFNGDTGSNYSWHYSVGGNNTIDNGAVPSSAFIRAGFTPRNGMQNQYLFSFNIMDIVDYASTNKNKTVRVIGGVDDNTTSSYARVGIFSGVWRSNSAVTSITLKPEGSSVWNQFSHFALYGIRSS